MRQGKDWVSIIKRYESRSGTLEEFAKSEGIKPATLQYHVTKSRKSVNSFHAVSVEQLNPTYAEMSIEFVSGVKVTIRG